MLYTTIRARSARPPKGYTYIIFKGLRTRGRRTRTRGRMKLNKGENFLKGRTRGRRTRGRGCPKFLKF